LEEHMAAKKASLLVVSVLVLLSASFLPRCTSDLFAPSTNITISGTVSLSQTVSPGHYVWIGLLKSSPISAPSSVLTWVKYQQVAIAPGAMSSYSFSNVTPDKYVVGAFYDLNDNAVYDANEPVGGYPAPNGFPLFDFSSDFPLAHVTINPAGAGATPSIGLSAASLNFFAAAGGANPSGQTVSITNTGGGTLSGLSATVSYGSGSGWLSATLSATTAPATLTVQPSASGLSAGSYTATLSVASSVSGTTAQSISVSFSVSSQGQTPSLWLSSSTLSFTGTVGGASPSEQTVSVNNAGGGTLSGLSATVSYGSGSGWLTATLGATTAPATLTVQPTTGSLAVGTYTATVSVASSVSGTTAQNVTVFFTVTQAPVIGLSTSSLSFFAAAGGRTRLWERCGCSTREGGA
jgi:hypothetical protein